MKPIIPEAVLGTHVAVLGKTGSGKTSTAKLIAEQVVPLGARVCVLDTIKSDWWGITSSADGKKPGLPFHILGGPHGHVPLHSGAGRALGELVGSGKLPLSIIDMADFEAGGLHRFFVDFAPALLRAMRGVLYLFIEEAHELAPKERAGWEKENMAIHFAKKIATAGRSKGIRMIVCTQATQSLHNRVLGSCETMIVHRFTAPAEQEPVLKWLKANARKEWTEQVANSLSSLRTGSAWMVSGEAQIFQKVDFPKIKTYDNSATPTDDTHQLEVKTAPVDQEKLRAIIGDAVKEAEESDPKRLKATIAKLEAEAAKRQAAAPAKSSAPAKPTGPRAEDVATIKTLRKALEATMKFIVEINAKGFFDAASGKVDKAEIEKAIVGATQTVASMVERHIGERNKEVAKLREQGERILKGLQAALDSDVTVSVSVRHNEPFTVSPAASRLAWHRPAQHQGGSDLPQGERRILAAIAQHHAGVTREQLTVLTGYKKSSRDTYLQRLASRGLVDLSSRIVATDTGIAALGSEFERLPTGKDLRDYWLAKLPEGERRVLDILILNHPDWVTREHISSATEYKKSSRDTYIQRLSARELVEIERGTVRASAALFD